MIPTEPASLAGLAALVFAAAVLYSSVGHGGASGYLAAMALFGVAPDAMKPAALVMNVIVALVGAVRFGRAGLVPWRMLAALLVGSVPAAFAGGLIRLSTASHKLLLGVVLLFAAGRLLWLGSASPTRHEPPPALSLAMIGAALGLVSGLTGVGGGIFLSPLLLLNGWEDTRRTAGASTVFILANSASGLLGHLGAARPIPSGIVLLSAVALIGALIGSSLGVRRLPTGVLRRLLAAVLVVAGGKLLFS
jgi:hypothetical protein